MLDRLNKALEKLPSVTGGAKDIQKAWTRFNEWEQLKADADVLLALREKSLQAQQGNEEAQYDLLAVGLEAAAKGVSLEAALNRIQTQLIDVVSEVAQAGFDFENSIQDDLRTRIHAAKRAKLAQKSADLLRKEEKGSIAPEKKAAIQKELDEAEKQLSMEAKIKPKLPGDDLLPEIEKNLSHHNLKALYEKLSMLLQMIDSIDPNEEKISAIQRASLTDLRAAALAKTVETMRTKFEAEVSEEVKSVSESKSVMEYLENRIAIERINLVEAEKASLLVNQPNDRERIERNLKNYAARNAENMLVEEKRELASRYQNQLQQTELVALKLSLESLIKSSQRDKTDAEAVQIAEAYVADLMRDKNDADAVKLLAEAYVKEFLKGKSSTDAIQSLIEKLALNEQEYRKDQAIKNYIALKTLIAKKRLETSVEKTCLKVANARECSTAAQVIKSLDSKKVLARKQILQNQKNYDGICAASKKYLDDLGVAVLEEARKDSIASEAYWVIPQAGAGFVEQRPLPSDPETLINDSQTNRGLKAALNQNAPFKSAIAKYNAQKAVHLALTDVNKEPSKAKRCENFAKELAKQAPILKPRRDTAGRTFLKAVGFFLGAVVLAATIGGIYAIGKLYNAMWVSRGERFVEQGSSFVPMDKTVDVSQPNRSQVEMSSRAKK